MVGGEVWKWIGVQGLLTLGFGLAALAWPGATVAALLFLLVVLGVGSTVAGVTAAMRRQDVFLIAAAGAYGLGAVGLAVFGLLLPGYAILVCLIAVLIQALAGGLALISYGLWQYGHRAGGWPAIIAGAVIALVGVAVWLLPPAAPDAVMGRIGLYAVVQGVLLGGAGLLVRATRGPVVEVAR